MQNYENAVQMAKQLAGTPDGKKLIALLQQMDGTKRNQIINLAAAGDYSAVQEALSGLMENPEARKLLENLGR